MSKSPRPFNSGTNSQPWTAKEVEEFLKEQNRQSETLVEFLQR
jgi:hypothetical protein